MSDKLIDTGSQNVTGYRKQTPEALAEINAIKNLERQIANHWRRLMSGDLPDGPVPVDPRQMAMARTHFEDAFMHLNRAVFQPVDPFAEAT